MEWNKFEDTIKELLKDDQAITVPGSGNGKGEEDIIGFSTIAQCKYTNKDNISILKKDIDRLLSAGKLHNKMPLFCNKSNKNTIISIIDSDYTENILKFIILLSSLQKIEDELDSYNTIKDLNSLKTYVSNVIDKKRSIINTLNNKFNKLYKQINDKYNNLIQYDLFEQENIS